MEQRKHSKSQSNECLFCGTKKGSFCSEEHIIPESLGNNELILPKRTVCDRCNNGILSELDNALVEFDPILFFRTFHGAKNKEGKIPASAFSTIKMQNPTGGYINIELPKMTKKHLEKTHDGFRLHWKGKKRMTTKNIKLVARALYKIGLEVMCLDYGPDFVYAKRFDEIREIVLGRKNFNGYLFVGTNQGPSKPDMKAGIAYRFLKSQEDDKEFAIFEFNYFLVKIIFDMERRICKLENEQKIRGLNILKF